MTFTRRNHVIGNPPCQTQPGLLHGLSGQHGVIDTAKLHPHHQNDRKLLGLHPVSKCLLVGQRGKPAASPLHQHPVGLRFQVA